MKLDELCAAVQEARYYNERFTRREYTSPGDGGGP